METYEITFTVMGIPESDFGSVVDRIEMSIKSHGFDVHTGIGRPE